MDLPKFAVHNGVEMVLIYSIQYADVVKVHYETRDGKHFWTHYVDSVNEFTKTNVE